MAYQHLNGNEKISESYTKINDNFDGVDTAATAHKTAATLDHPDGSVSTAKLADKAATRAKIGDNAVGTGQLGDAAVTAAKLADGSVTAAKLGAGAVGTGQIADGSITAAKVAADVATQAELDTHAADTTLHVTAAEHTKLAGIAAGAEVNQNAFSKIVVTGQGDIIAQSETGTLTFAAGTGLTITTDPAAGKLTFTATGESTPGPHASSHITGGTYVIPIAVTGGASGLMSGADATFVRFTGETKTGAQSKADAAQAAATSTAASDATAKANAVQTNLTNHAADAATGAHKAKNIAVEDTGNHFAGTNVESVLTELFTFANGGKTAVASAITAKGVSASPSDTFSALATKIGLIPTGKKYNSGVATSAATPLSTYVLASGSTTSAYPLTVTGLDFTPSVVLLIRNSASTPIGSFVRSDSLPVSAGSKLVGLFTTTTISYVRLTGDAYLTSGGFSLPTPGNSDYQWIAYE
ncbi:hypothetical protein [Paenibacillus sp. NFR01]|uniref:hypothetical protein n=1 Tax=Paenibacillus sp. NFR01 TaxID=1566279 RepID=UPI0008B733FA|nr:hypothetical protein [Paenibacillus sp. NFR01]SET62083.1 hypothetical protein SAMN03159358_2208 [Paenibacillus sp. NFR01]